MFHDLISAMVDGWLYIRYSTARVGAGIPRPMALITDTDGEYPPLRAQCCWLITHPGRRKIAANWLSQLDFFWDIIVDVIPGDHNSTAHQMAQRRQSGAR